MPAKKKTAKKTAARSKTRQKAPAKRTSTKAKKARPARKKPETLRLRTASPSLTVNDLQKSIDWYTKVLGFTINERWEDGGKLTGVEMVAGSVNFYIGQDDWKKGRDRVKGEGFRLYCTTGQDIDVLAEQIKKNGGTLVEEPHDGMGARMLAVADPDGFKVSISKEK
jgi:uncharacterized glyoxalase superfamily protein PhnB